MSVINTNAKEIHCKIVYCGPKNSGKKTALSYIRDQFEESKRNFFKLPFQSQIYGLVLSIGKIFGFQAYFHIYNLNNETLEDNKTLLNGADGIVFIASSDSKDRQANKESLLEIESFFKSEKENLFKFPLVLQYNKRDIEKPLSLKELRKELNKYNNQDFESSIINGKKVLEPLKQVCKLILNDLKRGSF